MQRVLVFFILLMISTGLLMGCNDDKNSQIQSEPPKKLYEITKNNMVDENRNINVNFPQIEIKDENLNNEINKKLQDIPIQYINGDSYLDVDLEYEVKRDDNKILSIVYTGKGRLEDIGDILIKDSVNIDMTTGKEITLDNLIIDDENARKHVDDMLNIKAQQQGLNEFESQGSKIYFTSDYVVVYYMPSNDPEKRFVELKLSKDELGKYSNVTF